MCNMLQKSVLKFRADFSNYYSYCRISKIICFDNRCVAKLGTPDNLLETPKIYTKLVWSASH